jgi:hypothetical protein
MRFTCERHCLLPQFAARPWEKSALPPFVASWFVASSGTRDLTGIGLHAIAVLRAGGAGCTGFSLIPVCKGGRCYYGRRPFGLANLSRNSLPAIWRPQLDCRRLRGER